MAAHAPGQSIPPTLDVTRPPPAPPVAMPNANVGGAKVAVTLCAAPIVTVHGPVPEHAPPQPANVLPPFGVAVSVTLVPVTNALEHVPGQFTPAGLDVTAPVPAPAVATVSGNVTTSNVAVTDFAALIVTVHVVVDPLHAPPHPVNALVALGAAVSVTVVPAV